MEPPVIASQPTVNTVNPKFQQGFIPMKLLSPNILDGVTNTASRQLSNAELCSHIQRIIPKYRMAFAEGNIIKFCILRNEAKPYVDELNRRRDQISASNCKSTPKKSAKSPPKKPPANQVPPKRQKLQ